MSYALNPKVSLKKVEKISNELKVYPIDFTKHVPFAATFFHLQPGGKTPLDFHIEKECWMVLQGSGILIYEGSFYHLVRQNIFYFDSYKKHQLVNNSQEVLIVCSWYWQEP
ncbi:Cupin domain [Legionella beliardensis]|uniref:Cupin domain n=1 Tax=Legionella beliardensis TaxID=91822 RepID=A0A378HYD3_9GAMM|nr:cupin domain-containing protein [Legionella beliardensis]STX27899.1 Cupin domain [Legionella beliardensis]